MGTFLPLLPILCGLFLLNTWLPAAEAQKQPIKLGAILPRTSLITVRRSYEKRLQDAIEQLKQGRAYKFNFTKYFDLLPAKTAYLPLTPSPNEILDILCGDLLSKDVALLLYLTNSEVYGSNAASAQYLLQLAGYLGLPVIAWNADNMGLEHRVSQSQVLQLAPSVEHQASAILSILRRYDWKRFSVVTSNIGGHDKFVRAVRDQANEDENFKYKIINIINLVHKKRYALLEDLQELANSEARIVLLFCSKEEASEIMAAAEELELTGKNYVWIVTQSVVGTGVDSAPSEFPPGMLGIHFNTTQGKLLDKIDDAVSVFGHGLELFINDPRNINVTLTPNLTCTGTGDSRWSKGDVLARCMREVSFRTKSGRPNLQFNPDGTLKFVELEVMNLNNGFYWEKIGTWTEDGLEIKDIVWPGDSPHPPLGVPEKFNLRVTVMEEPPYVNMVPPDNETGECKTSHAVQCRVVPEADLANVNMSEAVRNPKYFKCCSGFCIDLLQKFASDLKFSYDLYRVEDGIWGVLNENGSWNGLVAEIVNQRADMVVTSFKMNSDRQTAVDFTVPFLETGIAILVAKRTGIISPKAFLEPFDTMSWLMILLITIQVAAVAIFIFEWLSPSGYDKKMRPPRDHKFSLFRTYWLVWAILFGAAVNVDCPRGYTARFMSNVWAMFTVVFLAIYTANLAAFMITREEFYNLSGIEDYRLENPLIKDPPFRYGTVPYGNTWAVLKKNKPQLFDYMRRYNRTTVQEGLRAVKKGEMDAFVYDATVLEYLAAQDNECRLLTVGAWYAMTGYGFAMPKKSKYLNMFNDRMVIYKENGDLERLQRFWFQGSCRPTREKQKASNPLDFNQFISAFLLLGCGALLTGALLAVEHVYFRYVRKHLAKKDTTGCCTLVSLSMGKSLSFRGAVYEAQDLIKHHRCKDPVCDTQLWKARHQLDMAQLKIQQLQQELTRRSPSDSYYKPRDLTVDHVSTNESQRRFSPHRDYRKCSLEIAEIETVL